MGVLNVYLLGSSGICAIAKSGANLRDFINSFN
jgi:hypothetical protein